MSVDVRSSKLASLGCRSPCVLAKLRAAFIIYDAVRDVGTAAHVLRMFDVVTRFGFWVCVVPLACAIRQRQCDTRTVKRNWSDERCPLSDVTLSDPRSPPPAMREPGCRELTGLTLGTGTR